MRTRVWLWSGTKAKFLQESRFLPSPDCSSPSPRCPPRSERGLRWGPRRPGCPLPPAQPGTGSRGPCGAQSPATLPPAALMTGDGRYVLNGDWSIAWPGPFEAAGTQLLYARAPDGAESLEAPGPTAEDLHLMVMLGTAWGRGHPPGPHRPPERCPCPRRSCCRSPTLASSTSSGCPAGPPSPAVGTPAPCGSPSLGGPAAPRPQSRRSPRSLHRHHSPGALSRSQHRETPPARAGPGLPQVPAPPGGPHSPLGALLWSWGVPGVLHVMGTLKKVPLA